MVDQLRLAKKAFQRMEGRDSRPIRASFLGEAVVEETCFFLVDDWGECEITNDRRVSFVFLNHKQDRKKIDDFFSNAILHSLL